MPPPHMFDSDQENTAPIRPPLRHTMTNLARDLHSTLSMSPGGFQDENDENVFLQLVRIVFRSCQCKTRRDDTLNRGVVGQV